MAKKMFPIKQKSGRLPTLLDSTDHIFCCGEIRTESEPNRLKVEPRCIEHLAALPHNCPF